MEILKDFKNELLNRRELKVIVEAEKNPTTEEATKIIVDEFKGDAETIVVNNIKGRFGRNTFLIVASIYKTKEDKEKIEPKSKKKEGEGDAAPEAPAEQPAAKEKPADTKDGTSEAPKEEPASKDIPSSEGKE